MIGGHGFMDLNPSGVTSLDYCSLCIMNAMFEQKGLYLDTLLEVSDFAVVSPDLQPYVLDTQVKRGLGCQLIFTWL